MVVYIKLLSAAFFWGGTYIAGRIIAQEAGPLASAFMRYVIASTLLLILFRHQERPLPAIKKHQIFPLILLGATGIFSYNILFFLGMKTVEAGRASLIVATNPLFIALFAALFLQEKLSLSRLGGVFFSLVGAVIVISRGTPLLLDLRIGSGELFLLGCALSWTAYSLLGKGVMQTISPLAAVAYSSLIGTMGLLPLALWEGLAGDILHYTGKQWSAIFYLSVFGTVISFLWYYEGIKKIGPSRAAIFINFVPVSALFLSWLVLGEPLSPYLFVGAILVIIGAWLGNKTN